MRRVGEASRFRSCHAVTDEVIKWGAELLCRLADGEVANG